MFMKRGMRNQETCGRKEILIFNILEPQNWDEERVGIHVFQLGVLWVGFQLLPWLVV